MAKKLNKTYAFVLLAFFIFNTTSPLVSGYLTNFEVEEVEFKDAWYADLDDDGIEDDIGFIIEIELECNEYHSYDYFIYDSDDDKRYYYNDYDDEDEYDEDDYVAYGCSKRDLRDLGAVYYLNVQLVLPSGFEYSYDLERVAYRDDFKLQLNLYNHATEPGWYWGYVTGLDSNLNPITETDSIYFDPPGSGDGGIPKIS